MRYEHSSYPEEGFDFDQTIDWQDKSEALLEMPTESLSEVEQLALGGQIKSHVLELFQDKGSTFYVHGTATVYPEYSDSEAATDALNWQQLKDNFFTSNLEVDTQHGGPYVQEQVYGCITNAASLERLPQITGEAQEARAEIDASYEANKATYGSKYANLRATTVIAQKLNDILGQEVYQVPPFIGVPVTVYTDYLREGIDSSKLQAYLNWVGQHNKNGYWVRSSALKSEDAEDTTAAGIYESVFVEVGGDVHALATAMKAVYDSVDSDKAKRYRAEHGISDERMGIVIQANVANTDGTGWGYSNGIVPGLPQLQEVQITSEVDEAYSQRRMIRMPFWRDKTLLDIAHPPHTYHGQISWDNQQHYSQAPYFAFDMRRINPIGYMQAAYLSRFSELVYGQPVQQEFISSDYFYAVQTRPLPSALAETEDSFDGFPNGAYHYSGRALGIANGIEGVPIEGSKVKTGIPRDGKPYIVVSKSNFGMSAIQGWMLEGAKAVVVVDDQIYTWTGAKGAHLETLCGEMGIPCSFATYVGPDGEIQRIETVFKKLISLGNLTLYMDGLQSRVY